MSDDKDDKFAEFFQSNKKLPVNLETLMLQFNSLLNSDFSPTEALETALSVATYNNNTLTDNLSTSSQAMLDNQNLNTKEVSKVLSETDDSITATHTELPSTVVGPYQTIPDAETIEPILNHANGSINQVLNKIKNLLQEADSHIQFGNKITQTNLLKVLSANHGMEESYIYPILRLYLESHPDIKTLRGRYGGIERIRPRKTSS